MVGDIVGFTAEMAIDEQRALSYVVRMRRVGPPLVKRHGGRWIKDIGDGFLASFDSAVAAVECALDIQRALASEADFKMRLGVHLGDVLFTDDDVYGDGVNVAARIEMLAPPGGVCVSQQVHELVRNQSEIRAVPLGVTDLPQGVTAYAVAGDRMPLPKVSGSAAGRARRVRRSRLPERAQGWVGRVGLAAAAIVAVAAGLAAWTLGRDGTSAHAPEGRAVMFAVPAELSPEGAPDVSGAGRDALALRDQVMRSLRDSSTLQPVPPADIADLAAAMRVALPDPGDPAVLTVADALRIARRDGGIRTAVAVDVSEHDGRFVLSVDVIDPTDGERLALFEEMSDAQGLPSARRRVAAAVARELADALENAELPAHASTPPPDARHVTTASDAAFRYYRRAWGAAADGDWPGALAAAERALEEDDDFPSAQLLAVAAHLHLGSDPNSGTHDHLRRARSLAAQAAGSVERGLVNGGLERAAGRCEVAAVALAGVEAADADFAAAHAGWGITDLAGALRCAGREREALEALETRASARGTDSRTAEELIQHHLFHRGDLAAARREVRRIELETEQEAAAAIVPVAAMFPVVEHAANGEIDRARIALDGLPAPVVDVLEPARLALHWAALETRAGRFPEARRSLMRAAAEARARDAALWEAEAIWQSAWLAGLLEGPEAYAAALRAAPVLEGEAAERLAAWTGVAAARSGADGAVEAVRESGARLHDEREARAFGLLAEGAFALAAGEPDQALAKTRAASSAIPDAAADAIPAAAWSPVPALWQAVDAAALAELDAPQARIAALRALTSRRVASAAAPSAVEAASWVYAHYELGLALEEAGDPRAAAAAYSTFLQHWGGAIALTAVSDARARTLQLGGSAR